MKLNLKAVPKLVGEVSKDRFGEISTLLSKSNWPVYLVGPSGSGKSIMAMNLAKWYSKHNDVPAYYVQLSPDQTKTSLILGLRLIKGSLVPVKGLIANAMEEGAIVVVDEASHATQELLLMFNSICDRTSITAIGDAIIEAKDSFRVIFASNNSTYAGNTKLPQSFAQRMIAYNFDYPSKEDEIKIAMKISKDEYDGEITVPVEVVNYITSLVREFRTPTYPLSVRNIAASVIMLQIKSKKTANIPEEIQTEAVIRKVHQRLTGEECNNINEMLSYSGLNRFLKYISSVGLINFKEAILSSTMYYLDADGFSGDVRVIKDKIFSSIF